MTPSFVQLARTLTAVALLALAPALASCQPAPSDPPSALPAPSVAATDGAPNPAASGPTVTQLQRVADALPAGRYTHAALAPRITLTVEGGTWRVGSLSTGFFDIQDAPTTPDVVAVQFARPEGIFGARAAAEVPADAAAAVELLRENPNVSVIESSESRMGGLTGYQVTIENPTTATDTASVMDVPPGTLGFDPGRRLWIAFFDTPDGLLAIMVGGSVAKWDDALLLAEPVLESVTIDQ